MPLFAQDPGDIENLLVQEVENWNPVYKPVIGVGGGSFNFFGDIHNTGQTLLNGDPGFTINVATYLDNRHFFRGNFYVLGGSLSGNQRSYTDTALNFNFHSSAFAFGFNVNYDFDHFISPQKRLKPYVSLGLEMVTFDSKTDQLTLIEGVEVPYHYWTDGSIRDESQLVNPNAELLRRDFIYETNVKDIDFGYKDYASYSIAIPLEAGLDFQVTNRLMFRVGTSLHYTLSDEIDHVSHKNTQGIIGDKQSDFFTFTQFSIHLDLFSSAKMLKWEKVFAELEFDNTLMGDEDGDGWFDALDQCPGTPWGVKTDTIGCPIDSDLDRIPDYLDDEPYSQYGAIVDDKGVAMSDEDVIASLDMSKAVARKDIAMYVRTPASYSNYKKAGAKEIPEKFVKIDKDLDGYISFDEMMDAVDGYFDFESDFSTSDIYELNDFFFSQ